jgi:predicted DNA-binding transcriptional regulator AlpA
MVKIITTRETQDRFGRVSRSTLNRWIATDPTFPRPRQVGPIGGGSARIGFIEDEVEAYISARPVVSHALKRS